MANRINRLRVSVLSLGLLSLVVAMVLATFSGDAPSDQAHSSGQVTQGWRPPTKLEKEWDRIRRNYAEVRWQYFPGLRLTRRKEVAARNLVLEHALLRRHWWDGASGTVALVSVPFDSEYTPEVDGVSFELIGEQGRDNRIQKLGRFEYVQVFGPSFNTPASVHMIVYRAVGITRARHRSGERGCRSTIAYKCRRRWGDWNCKVDPGRNWRDGPPCEGPLGRLVVEKTSPADPNQPGHTIR